MNDKKNLRKSIYRSWNGMKQRCYNEKSPFYYCYGGRGITVCERWLESFQNFYDDMGDKPEGKYSLDRLDVNDNYYKENCRWATDLEQANNMTTNINLTYNNKTQTVSQWADEFSISANVIRDRIKLGWTTEEVLNKPVKILNRNALYLYKGEMKTSVEIAKLINLPAEVTRNRLKAGWSIDKIKNTEYNQNRALNSYFYNESYYSVSELSQLFNLPKYIIRLRLKDNWSIEKIRDTPHKKYKTIKNEGIVDSQTEKTLELALNENQ